MPRDAGLSKNEREFIVKALGEGLRLDGRKFDEYRSISLVFGEEFGSVQVSFGNTM
jgi:exosome complex component RRP45